MSLIHDGGIRLIDNHTAVFLMCGGRLVGEWVSGSGTRCSNFLLVLTELIRLSK